MATTFKSLGTNDIVTTRTLLHEAIPLTGTIVSGTYGDENIKNYAHGMFQSVFDYPYLSSSANHIFDITLGYSSGSSLSGASAVQNAKKINLYNQMSQLLMGYDTNGGIRGFTAAGINTGSAMNECIFINFARLLVKDEIKKGSFNMVFGMSGAYYAKDLMRIRAGIGDTNAQNDYRVDSPAGEYGVLYSVSQSAAGGEGFADEVDTDRPLGLIFYQAGVIAVTGAVFSPFTAAGRSGGGLAKYRIDFGGGEAGIPISSSFDDLLTGSEISSSANSIRNRLYDLSFNNTTELNSTIYFCRAGAGDFNYSANPTYLTESKVRVKNESTDSPVSYITTVGLYSSDNELLAVAKLSEPLKKTPDTEFTIRTRLDY